VSSLKTDSLLLTLQGVKEPVDMRNVPDPIFLLPQKRKNSGLATQD